MQLIDIRLSKESMKSDCLHSGEFGANLYPASPDTSFSFTSRTPCCNDECVCVDELHFDAMGLSPDVYDKYLHKQNEH